MRGLFIQWGGVYTPSVDDLSTGKRFNSLSSVYYLSTGEGCTLPPWIIYPLERGVHFLRGLFIHLKGVYTPSVDCLFPGKGCILPP